MADFDFLAKDGVMEAGQISTVKDIRQEGPMMVVEAAVVAEYDEQKPMAYRYSPATSRRLSVPSLQEDPLEKAKVEVRPSDIPGAGDGLFTRGPAAAGEVLRCVCAEESLCTRPLQ
jgi:hypothetical protein